MAKLEGKLAFWNSERGFGFIKPKLGGKDVFVHIRDLQNTSQAPLIGDTIYYEVKQGNDGRSRAYNAYVNGDQTSKSKDYGEFDIFRLILIAIPFVLSLYIINITYYPLVIYSVASMVCFFTYLSDKRKAMSDSWRIPEATLHLLEIIGGWPGALIAQQTVRHKTQKVSFNITLFSIVLLHFIAWIDYLLFNWSLFFTVGKFINSIL